ncbi:hypothetical protein BDV10DRAFT_107600 [Aspergillus recurvatus]
MGRLYRSLPVRSKNNPLFFGAGQVCQPKSHARVPGCPLSDHSGLTQVSPSTRRLPRCLASGLHPFGSLPFPPNTLLYDKSILPGNPGNLANTAVRSVILLMTSQPMCSGRLDAACPRQTADSGKLASGKVHDLWCAQNRTIKLWINHGGHHKDLHSPPVKNSGTRRPASKVHPRALDFRISFRATSASYD